MSKPTDIRIGYNELDKNIVRFYDIAEAITYYIDENYDVVLDYKYNWLNEDEILVHDIKWAVDESLDNSEEKLTIDHLKSLVDNVYNKLKDSEKPSEYTTGGEYYGSTQLYRTHGNMLNMIVTDKEYCVQVGGAYEYEDYKDELDKLYDLFPKLGWDIYGDIEIEDIRCHLVHNYGSNFSVYGIEFRENLGEDNLDEELVSDKEAFWNMRNETSKIAEKKYDEVNLILDGDEIRPISKEELANKFAVSVEHSDKGDYKTKEELEEIANKVGAEKIMFFVYKGQYGGEYSFLVKDEETAKQLAKEYSQKAYAKYNDKGEYNEIVVESLEEDIDSKHGDVITAPFVVDADGEKFAFDTKHNMDAFIERNKYSFDKIEVIRALEEDIEKHETLNSAIFDVETEEMLPEVREKLIEIVNYFVDSVHEDELDLDVKDIVLIGSNANYNYTKDSDLDIHIIASSKPDCNKKHLNQIYQAYKSMFNKNYDIYIHGYPAEVYVEMDEVNARSGGIYSIQDNKWLKQPKQFEIPDIDYDALYKEVDKWEERYFELVNYLDEYENASEEVDKYIDDIYEIRKNGIAEDGEFSVSNLVFKEIRNRGYLDNLKQLKTELASKEMSLESIDK